MAYSRGTAPSVLADVVVLPFNRPELAARLIERHARELAAVIIDPVPNRVGLMPATPELLETLRAVTAAHGILLIFDEVISFRIGYHGAQGYFGARPDITALGKIIGGGFPVGAVGGRAEVMAVFDPRGGTPIVPHAGTFNANPVTMAAGLAGMRLLDAASFQKMDDLAGRLRDGLAACFKDAGVEGSVTGVGSLFKIHPEQPHAGGLSQQPAERRRGRAARSHRQIPARPRRAAVDHRPRMPVDAHGGARGRELPRGLHRRARCRASRRTLAHTTRERTTPAADGGRGGGRGDGSSDHRRLSTGHPCRRSHSRPLCRRLARREGLGGPIPPAPAASPARSPNCTSRKEALSPAR